MYKRKNSRSSSSGSTETEPCCDKEGNRSSNGSQEWLGTGQKKGDTIDNRYNNDPFDYEKWGLQ